MVKLKLERAVAERLAAYCDRHPGPAATTAHWRRYGGMSRIAFAGADGVEVRAGAGFDGDYELNFRPRSPREAIGNLVRRATGRASAPLFREAYLQSGGTSSLLDEALAVLGGPIGDQKLLAASYFRVLAAHSAVPVKGGAYLEIGPGTGYLAALVRAASGSRLMLIDLPEILPFSFLYLHRRFPQASFRLPGEAAAEADMTFLTPAQLDEVRAGSIDLAVNTASFGEMLPADIRAYFAFLRRTLAREGWFFTVNRESKAMADARAPGEEIAVRFDDYPWLAGDRDALHEVSRFHERVQPGNTMRMRLCRLAPA